MGTAPNKVRAWFADDPRPKCVACIAKLRGLHSQSALRAALNKGRIDGWLREGKAHCAHCRRFGVAWRYQSEADVLGDAAP